MTGKELIAWRIALKLTKAGAADALGIHRNTYRQLETSKEKLDTRTRLACAALYARLNTVSWPWE